MHFPVLDLRHCSVLQRMFQFALAVGADFVTCRGDDAGGLGSSGLAYDVDRSQVERGGR